MFCFFFFFFGDHEALVRKSFCSPPGNTKINVSVSVLPSAQLHSGLSYRPPQWSRFCVSWGIAVPNTCSCLRSVRILKHALLSYSHGLEALVALFIEACRLLPNVASTPHSYLVEAHCLSSPSAFSALRRRARQPTGLHGGNQSYHHRWLSATVRFIAPSAFL